MANSRRRPRTLLPTASLLALVLLSTIPIVRAAEDETAVAASPTDSPLVVIPRCRAVKALLLPPANGESRDVFSIAGRCGVPVRTWGILANISVTAGPEDATVVIQGLTPDAESQLALVAAADRSASVEAILALTPNGRLSLAATGGPVNVTIDVQGFFFGSVISLRDNGNVVRSVNSLQSDVFIVAGEGIEVNTDEAQRLDCHFSNRRGRSHGSRGARGPSGTTGTARRPGSRRCSGSPGRAGRCRSSRFSRSCRGARRRRARRYSGPAGRSRRRWSSGTCWRAG